MPMTAWREAPGMSRWLGLLRFAWLFGASLLCLLLVCDSRYRDFPVWLFGPVVCGYVLLRFAGIASRIDVEERLMSAWLALRDNAFMSGQFIWVGFDYLGEADWPMTTYDQGLFDRAGGEPVKLDPISSLDEGGMTVLRYSTGRTSSP